LSLANKLRSRWVTQAAPRREFEVVTQPQLTAGDWKENLSPLSIYYALFLGHILLFRNCKALGGNDFYLGLTKQVIDKAPRGAGQPPALTLAETLSLMRSPPVDGGGLYEVLQMNIGSLAEGEWGEEPRSPLLADPRPELKEDSGLWEQLLALAVARDEGLAEALFALRWGGSRLVQINGQYAIRPQIGPGCWLKKEDYEDVRDIWLAPYKEQVAELLRRLKVASSKVS
jgi:hypothetical protein